MPTHRSNADCIAHLRNSVQGNSHLGLLFRATQEVTHQEAAIDTLEAIVALRRLLIDAEYYAVLRAREYRTPWQTIADALEVSRQSVHARWSTASPLRGY